MYALADCRDARSKSCSALNPGAYEKYTFQLPQEFTVELFINFLARWIEFMMSNATGIKKMN